MCVGHISMSQDRHGKFCFMQWCHKALLSIAPFFNPAEEAGPPSRETIRIYSYIVFQTNSTGHRLFNLPFSRFSFHFILHPSYTAKITSESLTHHHFSRRLDNIDIPLDQNLLGLTQLLDKIL